MAGGKKGENTKKAAGNAKKAEAAVQRQTAEDAKRGKAEEREWAQGAKSNAKKEASEFKAAEAARRKAEKQAQMIEEEASLPSKPKGTGAKTALKKNRGLDLSQLDASAQPQTRASTLNASGIDNALDALSLTKASSTNEKVDRHPERRFKAAFTAYEERRLEDMKDDKGLRRQQKVDLIRKEFEKSPENPFNQTLAGHYDMTKTEASELKESERERIERRLESN